MNTRELKPVMILGAAKSGTTSLYSWVNQHPDLCMTSPKEPYFFYTEEFNYGFDFYIKKYLKHWDKKSMFGEASQRNLYFSHAPERIHSYFPNARFLIVLREPIKRALSHYWHNFRRKKEYLSFDRAISEELKRLESGKQTFLPRNAELRLSRYSKYQLGYYRSYLETGHYAEQIQRYFEYFPPNNFKILLFEDMIENPKKILSEVFHFCGLDPLSSAEDINFNAMNKSNNLKLSPGSVPQVIVNIYNNWSRLKTVKEKILSSTKPPVVSDKTIEWLKLYYAPHNNSLKDLINQPLNGWAD